MPRVMNVDTGQVVDLAHEADVDKATVSGKWLKVADEAPSTPEPAQAPSLDQYSTTTVRPILGGPSQTVPKHEAHVLLRTGRYDVDDGRDIEGDADFNISADDQEKIPILATGAYQTIYGLDGSATQLHPTDAVVAVRSGKYSFKPIDPSRQEVAAVANVAPAATEQAYTVVSGGLDHVKMTDDKVSLVEGDHRATPPVLSPDDAAVLDKIDNYQEPIVDIDGESPTLVVEEVTEPIPEKTHYTGLSEITIGNKTQTVRDWCEAHQIKVPTALARMNKAGKSPEEALAPQEET